MMDLSVVALNSSWPRAPAPSKKLRCTRRSRSAGLCTKSGLGNLNLLVEGLGVGGHCDHEGIEGGLAECLAAIRVLFEMQHVLHVGNMLGAGDVVLLQGSEVVRGAALQPSLRLMMRAQKKKV